MITVEYTQNARPMTDQESLEFGWKLARNPRDFQVPNELSILSLRLAVKDNLIKHNEVQILFEGQIITIEPDGSIRTWPVGFCDHSDILFERLFDL